MNDNRIKSLKRLPNSLLCHDHFLLTLPEKKPALFGCEYYSVISSNPNIKPIPKELLSVPIDWNLTVEESEKQHNQFIKNMVLLGILSDTSRTKYGRRYQQGEKSTSELSSLDKLMLNKSIPPKYRNYFDNTSLEKTQELQLNVTNLPAFTRRIEF